MKCRADGCRTEKAGCRSRKGAWIEIQLYDRVLFLLYTVAPVRERGLKSRGLQNRIRSDWCRSRKGAWIEMLSMRSALLVILVAPVRERGLKSGEESWLYVKPLVAPVRERGLKYHMLPGAKRKASSLP